MKKSALLLISYISLINASGKTDADTLPPLPPQWHARVEAVVNNMPTYTFDADQNVDFNQRAANTRAYWTNQVQRALRSGNKTRLETLQEKLELKAKREF